jgi:cysteine synthase A
MIADSLIDLLGDTPVVRLTRLTAAEGLDAELFLKLEFLNPGGSHKARIAHNMVLRAEARGDLIRGSGQTIVEPTGGNTGTGLAIACKMHGYRLVVVVPDNYSVEKRKLLSLYGAEVILSDSKRGGNSHGELAQALLIRNPEWVMLNQQRNPANPEIHYRRTAEEILVDFADRPVDRFVGGVGTGGHLTGVTRRLRLSWPDLQAVAVQPQGCDFATATFVQHRIQGLAVGLVPANLDMSVVDRFVSVTYDEARSALLKLLNHEGIGVGLSTGANIAACLRLLREGGDRRRILCFAYDQIGGYLDEFEDEEISSGHYAEGVIS